MNEKLTYTEDEVATLIVERLTDMGPDDAEALIGLLPANALTLSSCKMASILKFLDWDWDREMYYFMMTWEFFFGERFIEIEENGNYAFEILG